MKFLKKYKLIIFLVVVIIVLILMKIFWGNKEETTKQIDKITPTLTSTPTGSQISKEELLENFYNLETEEERDIFLDKLTVEQRDYILAEESDEGYRLEDLLPYETDSFVVERYISDGLLLAKAKIDDKKKAVADLNDWLNQNEDTESKDIVVWH